MNYNNIGSIKREGFLGFKSIRDLMKDCSSIEKVKGVYLVLYVEKKSPKFLKIGTGPSLYKNITDPNVLISELKSNWVENTVVIYIGKAGGINSKGFEKKETLKKRLKTYLKFGQGKDVRHYGGRYIWQIKKSKKLIICWKKLPDQEPRSVEKKMIAEFKKQYLKRPFANLTD